MALRNLVVLTGAGVSAESGIQTFRDGDGLWEGYEVSDVATPEAWHRNPELVQRFYNERRKAVLEAQPNEAHRALVSMEEHFKVNIITQNIDDLHERAGSSNVLHLHGEIIKSRSSVDLELIYDIDGWELRMGETCDKGSQLRPFVVWFGEAVPMMDRAIELTRRADILVVIGTSLVVYPAASLVECAPTHAPIYLIDPNLTKIPTHRKVTAINKPATAGVPELLRLLN